MTLYPRVISAALRAQALYCTVSSMVNYAHIIQLAVRVQNPKVMRLLDGSTDKLERRLERMPRCKLKSVYRCSATQD